jgi:hypothetical protein
LETTGLRVFSSIDAHNRKRQFEIDCADIISFHGSSGPINDASVGNLRTSTPVFGTISMRLRHMRTILELLVADIRSQSMTKATLLGERS